MEKKNYNRAVPSQYSKYNKTNETNEQKTKSHLPIFIPERQLVHLGYSSYSAARYKEPQSRTPAAAAVPPPPFLAQQQQYAPTSQRRKYQRSVPVTPKPKTPRAPRSPNTPKILQPKAEFKIPWCPKPKTTTSFNTLIRTPSFTTIQTKPPVQKPKWSLANEIKSIIKERNPSYRDDNCVVSVNWLLDRSFRAVSPIRKLENEPEGYQTPEELWTTYKKIKTGELKQKDAPWPLCLMMDKQNDGRTYEEVEAEILTTLPKEPVERPESPQTTIEESQKLIEDHIHNWLVENDSKKQPKVEHNIGPLFVQPTKTTKDEEKAAIKWAESKQLHSARADINDYNLILEITRRPDGLKQMYDIFVQTEEKALAVRPTPPKRLAPSPQRSPMRSPSLVSCRTPEYTPNVVDDKENKSPSYSWNLTPTKGGQYTPARSPCRSPASSGSLTPKGSGPNTPTNRTRVEGAGAYSPAAGSIGTVTPTKACQYSPGSTGTITPNSRMGMRTPPRVGGSPVSEPRSPLVITNAGRTLVMPELPTEAAAVPKGSRSPRFRIMRPKRPKICTTLTVERGSRVYYTFEMSRCIDLGNVHKKLEHALYKPEIQVIEKSYPNSEMCAFIWQSGEIVFVNARNQNDVLSALKQICGIICGLSPGGAKSMSTLKPTQKLAMTTYPWRILLKKFTEEQCLNPQPRQWINKYFIHYVNQQFPQVVARIFENGGIHVFSEDDKAADAILEKLYLLTAKYQYED